MCHVLKTQVDKTNDLFEYFETTTKAANNLKNATRFRQRQVLTLMVEHQYLTADQASAIQPAA